MSKKIISLLLSLMLVVSMVAVAAVSVSAEVDEQGRYTPSEGTETYRYYFYMPSDWYNEYAETAGIYWWIGTDPADPWPGYIAHPTETENIYYCDVPTNVTTIISCVVLYLSGIGTVTGFATTLGIGVVLSMFTAIVVTKFLLKQLVNIGIQSRSKFYKVAKVKGGAEE